MFKKRIKLANQKVALEPFKAKEGLEILLELAVIIDNSVPMLTLLNNEHSNAIRVAALAKFILANPTLMGFLFNLVSKATGIPVEILESNTSTGELLTAALEIVKINNWNKFWLAAYSLRLVEKKSLLNWDFIRGYRS